MSRPLNGVRNAIPPPPSTSPSGSEASFVTVENQPPQDRVDDHHRQFGTAEIGPAISSQRHPNPHSTPSTTSNLLSEDLPTPRPAPITKALNPARTPQASGAVPSSHANGSYFALPVTTEGSDPLSPSSRRRAPASRSSHGIETASGPPPALSTQRSYNAESSWRSVQEVDRPHLNPANARRPSGGEGTTTVAKDTSRSGNGKSHSNIPRKLSSHKETHPAETGADMPDPARFRELPVVEDEEEDSTLRLRTLQGDIRKRRDSASLQTARQDLFLDLARSDSVGTDSPDGMSRGERRRVSHHSLFALTCHVRLPQCRCPANIFAAVHSIS